MQANFCLLFSALLITLDHFQGLVLLTNGSQGQSEQGDPINDHGETLTMIVDGDKFKSFGRDYYINDDDSYSQGLNERRRLKHDRNADDVSMINEAVNAFSGATNLPSGCTRAEVAIGTARIDSYGGRQTAVVGSSSGRFAADEQRQEERRQQQGSKASSKYNGDTIVTGLRKERSYVVPKFQLAASDGLSRKQRRSESNGSGSIEGNKSQEQATTSTTQPNRHMNLKCRLEKDLYLDFEEYKHFTCASCYDRLPAELFARKLRHLKKPQTLFYDELSQRTLYPNETDLIKPTFKSEATFGHWRACCEAATDCCIQHEMYLPKAGPDEPNGELKDDPNTNKCPATWDGFSCWSETPAGVKTEQICKDYLYFLEFKPDCNGRVSKQCFSNGSWYIRKGHEWSDYSKCNVLPLYATRLLIGSFWHIISALVIAPALIVLDKMPNRAGSKRIRILRNLLFWLLVNCLLSASQKIGIVGGIFSPPSTARAKAPAAAPAVAQPSAAPMPTSASATTVSSDFSSSSSLSPTSGAYNSLPSSGNTSDTPYNSYQLNQFHVEKGEYGGAIMGNHKLLTASSLQEKAEDGFVSEPRVRRRSKRGSTANTTISSFYPTTNGRLEDGADERLAQWQRQLEQAKLYFDTLPSYPLLSSSSPPSNNRHDDVAREASDFGDVDCKDVISDISNISGDQLDGPPKRASEPDRPESGSGQLSASSAGFEYSWTSQSPQASAPRPPILQAGTGRGAGLDYDDGGVASQAAYAATRKPLHGSNSVHSPKQLQARLQGNSFKTAAKSVLMILADASSSSNIDVNSIKRPSRERISSDLMEDLRQQEVDIRPTATAAADSTTKSRFFLTAEAASVPAIATKKSQELAISDRSCKQCAGHHNARPYLFALVVLICFMLSMAIRVTRLQGYAWMFTGAIYLCSVLHFAPAEPPAAFVKWLMFLTNAFPVLIGIVYMIARTIYEPSPLIILVQAPYYYLIGDSAYVEYLWSTQLDCWLLQSKIDFIEEIADFPNLVLIILNSALFVITLIIMCRINRPGSTRQEMTIGDYFKAAGTLVVLYGAHYGLVVYRPTVEGCIKNQVMYYSFLFVDGIQGIAVAYVFCYKTGEGRELIRRWWSNWRVKKMNRLSSCGFCCGKREIIEHSLMDRKSRSNQSTKTTNSICNGKDMTSELININETSVASRF